MVIYILFKVYLALSAQIQISGLLTFIVSILHTLIILLRLREILYKIRLALYYLIRPTFGPSPDSVSPRPNWSSRLLPYLVGSISRSPKLFWILSCLVSNFAPQVLSHWFSSLEWFLALSARHNCVGRSGLLDKFSLLVVEIQVHCIDKIFLEH